MTKYKHSLKNQSITFKDAVIPVEEYEGNSVGAFYPITLISVGVVMGLVLMATINKCTKSPEPVAAKRACVSCHNKHMAYTQYFKRNGSKTPEEMAYAVLQTRSPRLLSAVAVVESNGNPHLRSTGYKKRHHGAFQVNPAYHGNVERDAVSQALQAERILSDLTQEMPIKKALSVYGGDSTSKYQRKILAELVRVP